MSITVVREIQLLLVGFNSSIIKNKHKQYAQTQ